MSAVVAPGPARSLVSSAAPGDRPDLAIRPFKKSQTRAARSSPRNPR